MVETGVVYGRFQVLHLKHVEYILAAKTRCRKLYIGITFPDDLYVADETGVNYRTKKSANPLTYFERFEMIENCLLDFGVKKMEFDIIPFPIDRPDYLRQYTPAGATYFMSICDDWTEKNERLFGRLGLKTEILWRRDSKEKGTTGTQVRQRILAGEKWNDLVPRTVYDYVMEHKIDDRIRYTK